MKILVTGSAGFIGSNFVNWLLNNTDHQIIGIDNLSGGFMDNVASHGRNTFYNYDVNDSGLETIFENHKPDLVYHFAAYASEGRSNYISSFIHQNNTLGTAKVINQCIKHSAKLVFISSIAVYSGKPPFKETMTPNPIDCYGVSKYTSEMNVRIAGNSNGLDWRIVRPYNVYGENQNIWDASRNVCGIFMYQALNNEPMTIFGDGNQLRSFTYVQDILYLLYKVGTGEPWQITNIGSSMTYRVIELASLISEITGHDKIIHLPERHEIKAAYCESKFRDAYTDLRVGLEKMWEWVKLQPKRSRMIPPPLEILETNHPSIK